MFNLKPLVSPAFWFDRDPAPLIPANARLLFAAFALLFVLGVIVRVVGTRRKEDRFVTETFRRIGRLCVTMGLVGLVLYFFTYQEIPLLGMRAWFLVWGIALLVWVWTIVRYATNVVPAERQRLTGRTERDKYLPRPKS